MISGARAYTDNGVRRWLARAMARDLGTLVVPGLEIARLHGLDVGAAGLRSVASPRHASVLLVVGALPPALCQAAAVLYAQMMRPRIVLALGDEPLSPLPSADIRLGLSQRELLEGVRQLRVLLADGAFQTTAIDFEPAILSTRTEYTCPMHADVIRDEPGTCPRCGMTLIPREAQHDDHTGMDHAAMGHGQPEHKESTDHAHAEAHVRPESTDEDHAGMDHAAMSHGQPEHKDSAEHAHADKQHGDDHSDDHGQMNHDDMDMDFMSMVEVTRDLPRGSDGLQMDWLEVPFGPLFPGLPGGLTLTLTLDGDNVARAQASAPVGIEQARLTEPDEVATFVERISQTDRLAPLAYRLLVYRALENAANAVLDANSIRGRVGALERERICSHLGWLAQFGQQIGFGWLARRAAVLQLAARNADVRKLQQLRPQLVALTQRLQRTPLLKQRLRGIGVLMDDGGLRGPVARAAGAYDDLRLQEPAYQDLNFETVVRPHGDALERLRIRLAELTNSAMLIDAVGVIDASSTFAHMEAFHHLSGSGQASIETPRGAASLQMTLDQGRVISARLDTPSTRHLPRVASLIEQCELGDALTAVASLDLSPWEVMQ